MSKYETQVAFAKHYVEMVLVMFAGMLVVGAPLLLAADALGWSYSELRDDAPAAYLAGMGLSMTAPMVGWMHRRGHSWAANRAMAAAMAAPAAGAIVLLALGTTDDLHSLLMIEHVVVFPAMLIAMLPYRSEFTGSHGHAAAAC